MEKDLNQSPEELFGFEMLEDYGVDALGAAGTSCSNNSSHGSQTTEINPTST